MGDSQLREPGHDRNALRSENPINRGLKVFSWGCDPGEMEESLRGKALNLWPRNGAEISFSDFDALDSWNFTTTAEA